MFCSTCPQYNQCREICSELNKHLKSQGIYSAEWIRPRVSSAKRNERGKWREIPFSALNKDNKEDKNPYFGPKT